jgi:aryl-alcohol dehydrogenase-like predicted oxidoreductase
MEYRFLGKSGLKVSALSFGAATFGGGRFFAAWGGSNVEEARRMIDICIEGGVNLFDTADIYSDGAAEQILGAALKGKRDQVLIATKLGLPLKRGANQAGASRYRMIKAVDAALQRLDTDYIDILQLHGFDSFTPIEEVLYTFDMLVRDGKIRYVGASNYAGWHLMKSLAIADQHGWPRYIAHQIHYSLVGRQYEWELMPLGQDQQVGGLVWSPLGWGRLTGKIRRGQPAPEGTRMQQAAEWGLPVDDELLYKVVDALDIVAGETGKSIPQIALAWLLARPTITSVIMGARTEEQLRDNLGAVGWSLTADQLKLLNDASAITPPYPYYPYYADKAFSVLNPPIV